MVWELELDNGFLYLIHNQDYISDQLGGCYTQNRS